MDQNLSRSPWKRIVSFIRTPKSSRTLGLLALLVVALALPLTVRVAQQRQVTQQRADATCDMTGAWDTDFGRINFTQDNGHIGGSYSYNSGDVQGQIYADIAGTNINGKWYEQPSGHSGDITFGLKSDCNSFVGGWSGPNGSGQFNGTRVSQASAQGGKTYQCAEDEANGKGDTCSANHGAGSFCAVTQNQIAYDDGCTKETGAVAPAANQGQQGGNPAGDQSNGSTGCTGTGNLTKENDNTSSPKLHATWNIPQSDQPDHCNAFITTPSGVIQLGSAENNVQCNSSGDVTLDSSQPSGTYSLVISNSSSCPNKIAQATDVTVVGSNNGSGGSCQAKYDDCKSKGLDPNQCQVIKTDCDNSQGGSGGGNGSGNSGSSGGAGNTASCNIGNQDPNPTNSCLQCIEQSRGGTANDIKNLNASKLNSCTDNQLINYWCNGGVSSQASSQCSAIKTGTCSSVCSGAGGNAGNGGSGSNGSNGGTAGGGSSACNIGFQDANLTSACVSYIAGKVPGVANAIKGFDHNKFNSCSDTQLINYWCSGGVSNQAKTDCANLQSQSSVCGGSSSAASTGSSVQTITNQQWNDLSLCFQKSGQDALQCFFNWKAKNF